MEALRGNEKAAGLSKGAGYMFGIRRTFQIPLAVAWAFILSRDAMDVWLGEAVCLRVEEGQPYRTKDGTTGEFRVVRPLSHLRLTWKPERWTKASTIQVRVIPKDAARITISFHQENIPDEEEREATRLRWQHVIEVVEEMLLSSSNQ